jgi:hypothetical protein
MLAPNALGWVGLTSSSLVAVVYIFVSVHAADPWSGMVEGFYWTAKDAVHNHSGAYTAEQRVQALEFLAAGGLNTYLYAPQVVDLVAPLDAHQQLEWTATFARAKALGMRFMYGIRPRGGVNSSVGADVAAKVAQLASLGCEGYVLCFDDVDGGDTPEQVALQVGLAASLRRKHPALEAAFLPTSYSGHPKKQAVALAPIDAGIDEGVAVILTGTAIVPDSVQLRDFPVLPSGRRIVFYDNWAAEDTSTRIAWGLGRDTALPAELFGGSGKWGYVLNPCFPLERIVHQLARLVQLNTDASTAPASSSIAAIVPAASVWAGWLVQHGFANATGESAIRSVLETAVTKDQSFHSIAQLEAAYPTLQGVFS